MKKKILITLISLAVIAAYPLISHFKGKCQYPVFDVSIEGKSAEEGCLQVSEVIHHAHKTDTMVEVSAPHALLKTGETFSFQNKQEVASFLCKVILSSEKKQVARADTIKSSTRPHPKVIQDENNRLVATNIFQGEIIDRLFCMAH